MMLRGMAVPKAAQNVNAAKLMLDYIASEEGQLAFGRGGLTPARPGVKPGDGVRHTFSSIADAIGGESNMTILRYDPKQIDEYDGFLDRWKQAYNIR
jgi:iron(III) transport system substrate-binding protein